MDLEGLSLLLGAGFLVGLGVMILRSVLILSAPPRRTYAYAISRGLPSNPAEIPSLSHPDAHVQFSQWSFDSRGLVLPVWDIRGLHPAGPTIVLSHGWGNSRVTMLRRAQALLPLCSRLVLWDMPGHGDAPGLCTLGVREADDLAALLRVLNDDPGVRIVLYGFSLGAGVSIVRGNAPGVCGVIAEAPYRAPITPARNVMRNTATPYRLNLPPAMAILGFWRAGVRGMLTWPLTRPRTPFDRKDHAARLTVPLLVLHGSDDRVSPPSDGAAIAAAAPHGVLAEIAGGAHSDLWSNPAMLAASTDAVSRFIRGLDADAAAQSVPISGVGDVGPVS